jgi:cell fate regulator YaaT (PSP1 superfamily)
MEKINFITENTEQEEDVHIACDHSKEADKIAANPFLTRGLSQKPLTDGDNQALFSHRCCKLSCFNWLESIEADKRPQAAIAEVQFKNSHKEFFYLPEGEADFTVGDIVVVESLTGHDIGIVSLLGEAVKLQMKSKKITAEKVTKKIYRRARAADIEKWIRVVDLEQDTMMRSRYAAWDLNLDMKVNDVEYQGDGSKAIFYYSADDRVDFRELIKILAEKFKIRIEMRQIGVRQEAARLGGLGSCGREICCASWLNNFQSVSTGAARTQQLPLNPQKLAGQCGKLKCCLNYENETYLRELAEFPDRNTPIYTEKGIAYCQKVDIFKKLMWYSYKDDSSHMLYAIPLAKMAEIMEINAKKQKIAQLDDYAEINQGKAEDTNYDLDDLKKIND